ncbi:MAG TPA: acetyl-CoA C-acetyltransferase [Gemmatimonadaceae bacterium]|nr:acetyl-CoA C-acetyltransferase [Gemmatimonadaceae bacterium]
MSTDIVFLSAVRTPFGTFGGTLKDFSAIDLAVFAAKEAMARAKVDPKDIGHSVFGNVMQTTSDTIYFARHVALKAGCPVEVPALTVNRLCGSGFQAVVSGALEIMHGESDVCLVGGGESMSQAPHVARGLRWGTPLGKSPVLEDSLWEGLRDPVAGLAMAETAEKLAAQYKISRQTVDEYALRSQQKAKEAWDAGFFEDEVIGVPVKDPKTRQMVEFRRDEHMRPDTTAEGLAKLKPVFKADGVVTAGNASGIGDGGGAMVIASAAWAKRKGLKPLARLVSWGVAGVDPTIMGIGPAPASRIALKKAGMTLDQMDLIEINEAFAPQVCACEIELGIAREKFNVHGGAIALTHPLAASGARITAHLIHALRKTGKKYGLGSACIGGGQGIALILESLG